MNRIKNILLVYPQIPKNTFWGFEYALKFIDKKSSMPPLGLITVAGLFPDHYQLNLVDMNVQPLKDKHLSWADAVFVSAMIVQKHSLQQVIAICQKYNKKVVLGGPYATTSHKEINGVDHFLLGEVEDIFSQFLNDLACDQAKPVYEATKRPDITRTMTPRFDLLDMSAYASMAIQYSRGCPFHCEFCDIWTIYGNKPRLKSCQDMVMELDRLYSMGWENAVFIVDDNFIGNKNRVKQELLPTLIKWQRKHGYSFRFFTEASINLAQDDELMALMRDAGFNEVFVGIESPCVESLKETHKSHNLVSDLGQAVSKIQSYGIEVMGGFILGFDSDPDDIFERQVSFIQQSGIPKAMIGLLNALPGTRLHDRLQHEGRIVNASYGNNTHSLETNFKTKMDGQRLKDGYRYVLRTLYDVKLKNYFARCNQLLDNIGNSPFFQRDIHFKEIVMLLKSILGQIRMPYGYQYLKFIVRNYFKNRNSFAEAVRLSIQGHHFYVITQQAIKR